MKFLSVDLETTGINADVCQILEIGAVVVDTNIDPEQWRKFRVAVRHDVIVGEAYALSMHSELLKQISRREALTIEDALERLRQFVHESFGVHTFTVVGKNFSGFDKPFLVKHKAWRRLNVSHRSIDTGVLYWDPRQDGAYLPDSLTVKQRAGLPGSVSHTALEDAFDTALQLKAYLDKLPTLEEDEEIREYLKMPTHLRRMLPDEI